MLTSGENIASEIIGRWAAECGSDRKLRYVDEADRRRNFDDEIHGCWSNVDVGTARHLEFSCRHHDNRRGAVRVDERF